MTDIDKIARVICRESCAFYGEPPCFELHHDTLVDGKIVPLPWPNPNCDEPGCQALAAAVVAERDLTK
jgi:hypothetical protein